MPSTRGVVVLGSTSAIARAVAIEYGMQGYGVVVAARDQEENEIIAEDIRVRCNVEVFALRFEAEDYASHPAFVEQCRTLLNDTLVGVVFGVGYLEPQAVAQNDFAVARKIIDANYTGAVSVLELFAKYFQERRRGFIAGVSSVAGDRGRQSNYVYGSAKAAFTTYLQGLRNRLHPAGVRVITIKPGFVDTKMTFGMQNLFLVAAPEKAGHDIVRAIDKGKDVVYTPWFWRYIMLIMRHVPERIFKRTKT